MRIRVFGQRKKLGPEHFEAKDSYCKWVWLDLKNFGFPERWNNIDACNKCYVCKELYDIWLTDDKYWNLLPIRWRRRKLCVGHYKIIIWRTFMSHALARKGGVIRMDNKLSWRIKPPKKEGWYWYNDGPQEQVDGSELWLKTIYLVYEMNGEFLAGHEELKNVKEYHGYWAGPLESPE